ncbi:hypothetical protein ABTY59_32155 [Streptomyces sp. NPDC096079]|uniref:hypothetical protein n=1 Tax=Streptomyces sp. NPDC096079 TaxID=3155820 RepID=UPI003324F2F4
MSNVDDLLGPGFGRIVKARKGLEDACRSVVEMAQDVDDFGPMGTQELPAAVAALQSSEYLDEDESAARWVSRAFTAMPTSLMSTGMAGLAFGGAVLMMRAALLELDEAVAAVDNLPGPTSPGGTFSA